MKGEKSTIPVTDFIKVWCELCRIRIDAHEETDGSRRPRWPQMAGFGVVTEGRRQDLSSGLLLRTLFDRSQAARITNARWI